MAIRTLGMGGGSSPTLTNGAAHTFASAKSVTSITPHDSNANAYNAIYVGDVSGGAAIKVTTVDGDAVTFNNVIAGTILPVQTSLVWSTGTTATSLLGLNW